MARDYEEKTVKPANDAYTGMLAVALFALLIGCGVLYMDYSQYAGETPKKVDYSFRERSPRDTIVKEKVQPQPPDNPDEKKDDPDKKGGRP